MKKFSIIFIVVFSFFIVGCNNLKVSGAGVSTISVNDIIINKSYAYVNVGETIILSAQVYPFNANNQNILWRSDNNNIAEVDGGIVVGKSEGRTVITSVSEDGNFEDKCIIYVSSPKLDYSKYQNNSLNINNISSETELNNNESDTTNKKIVNDEVSDNNENYINYFEDYFNKLQELNNEFFNISKNFEEMFNNTKSHTISEETENNTSNQFYAFEYKYNSNGIDDLEDENTIFKDDTTIIKEFIK